MLRKHVVAVAALAVCAGWAFSQAVPDKEYVADENTVVLFHFNAGQELTDDSPLKNVGSGVGGVWSADGKFGGAMDCTKGGVATSGVPALPDAMTVEAWLKPSAQALTGYATIAHKGFIANNGCDRLYFTLKDGVLVNYPSFVGKTVLKADQWQHIAYVVTGTQAQGGKEYFFINGVLDKEQPSTWQGLQAEGYTPFGSLRNGSDGFAGLIDEVRISNIARPYPGVQPLAKPATPAAAKTDAPAAK